jgi:S-adenosylmethionine-diacylglycerol 3-amino-3-carboxypropyl transferase
LKVALIENDSFEDLFTTFGHGVNPEFRTLLKKLKGNLHPYAYQFWKQKSDYFKANKVCSSFYYRGTAGRMALIARHSFLRRNKRLRQFVADLLKVESLAEQKALYEEVQGTLWSGFVSWLVRQPMVMTLLGVPRAQIRLMEEQFPGGLTGYVRDKLEHVSTRVPFSDNYFWRVYLTGHYTGTCCPNYLRRENQEVLQERVSRITTHSTTVANFLRENPAEYSHYVLLDHQDWLASHRPQDLEEEWRLILENSRPGTRILMRSASPSIDYIPGFALERLRFDTQLADSLHQKDRVGTYGSTLLAEVVA